jgi:hypothetical protein
MIISASRRTDLPALYAPWFMNRVRAGWCLVPNPFNPAQTSRISLVPEDVELFVFWTRDPRPLLPHLDELQRGGYDFFFLFSLLNYPRALEPGRPTSSVSLANFRELAQRVGPERVVWRYDPLVYSNVTGPEWHVENYQRLARELRGHTSRCVVSFMESYRKARKRLAALATLKSGSIEIGPWPEDVLPELMRRLSDIAGENGMEMQSCAQERDFTEYGVRPGACIDAEYIGQRLGIAVNSDPDSHQRPHCRCAVSRDIGIYDTCPSGCCYCYAVSDFSRARGNRARHDPEAPSLLPLPEPKRSGQEQGRLLQGGFD